MEQKIYPYLTFVMEKCLDIHFATKEEKKQKEYLFKEMRISLELIKSYLTLCLDNKQITQPFYFDTTKRVEDISKQVLAWKNSIFQQS